MRRFITFLAMISLFLIPNLAFAHAELQKASPAANSVVREETRDIRLTFTSDLEKELSMLRIEDASGKEIALQNTQLISNQMNGKTAEPLPNGKITVKWSVIAKDGHPSQGSYTFQVQNEKAAPAAGASQDKQTDASELPKKVSPITYLPLFLGAIGILFLAWFVRFLKRKSNS
jgi:methionine-rich copper-binding protein CopC